MIWTLILFHFNSFKLVCLNVIILSLYSLAYKPVNPHLFSLKWRKTANMFRIFLTKNNILTLPTIGRNLCDKKCIQTCGKETSGKMLDRRITLREVLIRQVMTIRNGWTSSWYCSIAGSILVVLKRLDIATTVLEMC
jgi:hypothetical protein